MHEKNPFHFWNQVIGLIVEKEEGNFCTKLGLGKEEATDVHHAIGSKERYR